MGTAPAPPCTARGHSQIAERLIEGLGLDDTPVLRWRTVAEGRRHSRAQPPPAAPWHRRCWRRIAAAGAGGSRGCRAARTTRAKSDGNEVKPASWRRSGDGAGRWTSPASAPPTRHSSTGQDQGPTEDVPWLPVVSCAPQWGFTGLEHELHLQRGHQAVEAVNRAALWVVLHHDTVFCCKPPSWTGRRATWDKTHPLHGIDPAYSLWD